jgi:hypothetical protein
MIAITVTANQHSTPGSVSFLLSNCYQEGLSAIFFASSHNKQKEAELLLEEGVSFEVLFD